MATASDPLAKESATMLQGLMALEAQVSELGASEGEDTTKALAMSLNSVTLAKGEIEVGDACTLA